MHPMVSERDVVLHTWTAQRDWNGPTIVGGEGAWFWDEHGRRYLDLSAQAECANLGHQHPRVVAAIQRQAAELCYVTSAWGARPRAELAAKLVEHAQMPGARVFFTLGGADANENAVRMARWVTGRPKIITRYRSYHGATAGAMELSGDDRGWDYPPGPPGVVHVPPPYPYRCHVDSACPPCTLRCADQIAQAIELEGPHTIAAVLVEPAAGTNGIDAPPEYWPRLREICDRYGVLLIADEVMSGFGRTGEWFAWQHWGGAPDLMALAKGLTGAHLPLGAVVAGRRVAEHFDDHVLASGLTYAGHPLACAAGLAAVEAYEAENLIARARDLGAWLHGRLRELAEDHPSVGDVRGLGLFAVLELVRDRASRAPLAPWPQRPASLGRLVAEGRRRGMSFATRGNLIILSPPLVISQDDLARGLDVLDELLALPDAEASA
jgi:taurine--2-oxoglutarate transaminase